MCVSLRRRLLIIIRSWACFDSIPIKNRLWGSGASAKGKRVVYTLSMGHRIHVLSYDELTHQVGLVSFGLSCGHVCVFLSTQTSTRLSPSYPSPTSPIPHHPHVNQVDVKHFLDRQGSNAHNPSNHRRYTYLLWVGGGPASGGQGQGQGQGQGRFQPVTQDFYRFPTPEYNWNYLDELICGYNDELRCVCIVVRSRRRLCVYKRSRWMQCDGRSYLSYATTPYNPPQLTIPPNTPTNPGPRPNTAGSSWPSARATSCWAPPPPRCAGRPRPRSWRRTWASCAGCWSRPTPAVPRAPSRWR